MLGVNAEEILVCVILGTQVRWTRGRKLSHERAVRILLLCPAAYDFLAVGGSRISSVVAFAEAR